ncbi:unnamed protein product [Arabidopsis arenosa]|uniref:Uncharacterized protein n=1 Tax=Arabidopsis arenosa TaxID=38785 RepID=A0A8S2B2W2_ARAAE|nr:unnamed protein product [Arabidopsis arenosa]
MKNEEAIAVVEILSPMTSAFGYTRRLAFFDPFSAPHRSGMAIPEFEFCCYGFDIFVELIVQSSVSIDAKKGKHREYENECGKKYVVPDVFGITFIDPF